MPTYCWISSHLGWQAWTAVASLSVLQVIGLHSIFQPCSSCRPPFGSTFRTAMKFRRYPYKTLAHSTPHDNSRFLEIMLDIHMMQRQFSKIGKLRSCFEYEYVYVSASCYSVNSFNSHVEPEIGQESAYASGMIMKWWQPSSSVLLWLDSSVIHVQILMLSALESLSLGEWYMAESLPGGTGEFCKLARLKRLTLPVMLVLCEEWVPTVSLTQTNGISSMSSLMFLARNNVYSIVYISCVAD